MTVKYQDPVNPVAPKVGDLRVWWNPQVGRVSHIHFPVASVHEGVRLLNALARYDLFQLEHRIKGDYANVGGLQLYSATGDEGERPGWTDWDSDDEASGYTGEGYYDDPHKYAADIDEDPFHDVLFAATTKLVYVAKPDDSDADEIPLAVAMTTGDTASLRVLLVPKTAMEEPT